ncbi:hypothetical protein J1P26_20715 [Neobacillus sp. MM2021_6]|uniref:hypothetical protein n=1 Tax=Bacillaceae TaxID=186817 RepID=UPI00140D93BB|nr:MULTISPECIES: hypothetical protein [Bacillaceae]MBO0962133.1 hypothetical protein [Neobacillus sp. MM2021_6]NHC20966.1 hypothetical protein [Bacillus sp. MM2020_4]
MELSFSKRLEKDTWIPLVILMIAFSVYNIFFEWQFQTYSFKELVDFFKIIIALCLSFIEAIITLSFLKIVSKLF